MSALALLLLLAAPKAEVSCDALKKATVEKPKSGAAWAALADCALRQGKKKETIAAAQSALRLDDAEARRAAYIVLSRAGMERRLPSAAPDDAAPACGELASFAGCAKKVSVCTRVTAIDTPETRYEASSQMVGFGTSREVALADFDKHAFSQHEKSGPKSKDTECVLVAVDACNQRVGIVCTTQDSVVGETATSPATTEAREIGFK